MRTRFIADIGLMCGVAAALGAYHFRDDAPASDWQFECAFEYSCQTALAPDGASNAMRFEVRQADRDGDRKTKSAEIASRLFSSYDAFQADRQAKIAFDLFFEAADMPVRDDAVVVAQIHAFPDQDLGEGWRDPIAAFLIRQGELIFRYGADATRVTVPAPQPVPPEVSWDSIARQDWTYSSPHKDVSLGDIAPDRWHSIAGAVKFDPEGNGEFSISFNGATTSADKIAIGYNDQRGPYLKLGSYPYQGRPADTPRVVYIRNLGVALGASPEANLATFSKGR